jgi:hypothetical protein
VTGSITFNGKPLQAGRVTFIGKNGKASDPGTITEGRYEVLNAPTGECKIKVDTSYLAQMQMFPGMPGNPGMPSPPNMSNEASRLSPEKQAGMRKNEDMAKVQQKFAEAFVEIPPDYADEEKTPLTFTVKSGSNNFDIELVAPPGWKPLKGGK